MVTFNRVTSLLVLATLLFGTLIPTRVVICTGCLCAAAPTGAETDTTDASAAEACSRPQCPACLERLAAAQARDESAATSRSDCGEPANALLSGRPSRCPDCLDFEHEELDLAAFDVGDTHRLPTPAIGAEIEFLTRDDRREIQAVASHHRGPPLPPTLHALLPLLI